MNYKHRLKKLQERLQPLGCDALIIDDPINLYYMTGLELSLGRLVVYADGALLMVDGRYFEACKKHSPFPVELTDTAPFKKRAQSAPFNNFKKVGFDSERTPYNGYEKLKSELPNATLIPVEAPLQPLRNIKDAEEIDLLKDAANLGSEGYDFVLALLEPGITEIALATELEIFWKRKGSKGLAFDPIIAFGPNSAMPHYRPNTTKLKQGDTVLIDIGVNLKHYHSDMTRTTFFGTPDPRVAKIYTIVKEAQEKALSLCEPGTPLGEIDAISRSHIDAAGYGQYYTHGLGHGVGLEIHEFPSIRKTIAATPHPHSNIPLEPGMVITIEPGIYLPGFGGVRIEDTILITHKGHENLTNRPK